MIDTINKVQLPLWMAVNLSPPGRSALHSDKNDPRELQEIRAHSLSSRGKHGIICRSFRQKGLQEVVAVTFALAGLGGGGEIV